MLFPGPIDKFLDDNQRCQLADRTGIREGDVLYFIADSCQMAPKLAGQIRSELGAAAEFAGKRRISFLLCCGLPNVRKG